MIVIRYEFESILLLFMINPIKNTLRTTSDTLPNESSPTTNSFIEGNVTDRIFWKHESPMIKEWSAFIPGKPKVNTLGKVPGIFSWPITRRVVFTLNNSTFRISLPISPVNSILLTLGRFCSETAGVDPIAELTRNCWRLDASSDYLHTNQESLVTLIDWRSGNVASGIFTISNRGKFTRSRDVNDCITPFSIVMDWRFKLFSITKEDALGRLFCWSMRSVSEERSRWKRMITVTC